MNRSARTRRIDRAIRIEELAWTSAIFVLTPLMAIGELLAHLRHGWSSEALFSGLLFGLGALLLSSFQLAAASKVGATFILGTLGAMYALSGFIYLCYGISVFLKA